MIIFRSRWVEFPFQVGTHDCGQVSTQIENSKAARCLLSGRRKRRWVCGTPEIEMQYKSSSLLAKGSNYPAIPSSINLCTSEFNSCPHAKHFSTMTFFNAFNRSLATTPTVISLPSLLFHFLSSHLTLVALTSP